jgi:acetyl esterase
MAKKIFLTGIIFLNLCAIQVFAQEDAPKKQPEKVAAEKKQPEKPTPDIANGKYGQYERNVFDLWKPKSKNPTPLLVYIHGGGFVDGDKSKLSANQLKILLENGIAVMAINYRLMPGAHYPDNYLDCVRAIQFARYKAKEWNIDKKHIAASGSSAGGITSLWIGFHDDLADPNNADPVLRESSRLSAMAVFGAQTTIVPEVVSSRIGEILLKHNFVKGTFIGVKPDEVNTPKAKQLFKDASPINNLTKDDPPVWAIYTVPAKPLTAESPMSDAIHHPNFGVILKEEMDKLKIECILRHKDDGKNINGDMLKFLLKYLK